MWLHRVSGAFILFMTLVFAGLLINDKSKIKRNFHSILGLIILIFVVLVGLGGVFARSRMNRMKWNTRLILRIKLIHKV